MDDIVTALARLTGGFLGYTFMLGGFALPLMAFIVTLNVRGIRRELARLNETLESGRGAGRPGVIGL